MTSTTVTPLCVGCNRKPADIPDCVAFAEEEGMTPDELAEEDGTYNPANGHFLCTPCYIAAGMPSSPTGWRAP